MLNATYLQEQIFAKKNYASSFLLACALHKKSLLPKQNKRNNTILMNYVINKLLDHSQGNQGKRKTQLLMQQIDI
jgi:hypothetical protein